MGALDGRVAIITGAGRGIGREHALLFAARGRQGRGERPRRRPARRVTRRRRPPSRSSRRSRSFGGEAIANHDDVADWEGGENLVKRAVDAFGDLHVLVNNAGHPARPRARQPVRGGLGLGHARPPEGPLRPVAPRRHLLARAGQGGPRGQGEHHQHVVDVGAARQHRPVELRRGQGRHRGVHGHHRRRARPLRRARQRDRARRAHPHDRVARPGWSTPSPPPDDASRFDVWDPANVSPLVAWLATERLPRVGQGLLRPGRRHPPVPELDDDRDAREGRPVHDRRARAGLPKLLQ